MGYNRRLLIMKKAFLAFVAVLLVVTSANAQSKNRNENIRYDKDSVAIDWYMLYTTDGKTIECLSVEGGSQGKPVIYTPLNNPTKSVTLSKTKVWKSYKISTMGSISGYSVYNIDYEAEDQKKSTPRSNNVYIDEISGKRRPNIELCRQYKVTDVIIF